MHLGVVSLVSTSLLTLLTLLSLIQGFASQLMAIILYWIKTLLSRAKVILKTKNGLGV